MPATDISVDRQTGAIKIKSPKDIDVRGFRYEHKADGSIITTFDSYKSKNDSDNIAAVANANAKMMDRVGTILERTVEKAASGAAQGVAPGWK